MGTRYHRGWIYSPVIGFAAAYILFLIILYL